jgi:hypothetical protein
MVPAMLFPTLNVLYFYISIFRLFLLAVEVVVGVVVVVVSV